MSPSGIVQADLLNGFSDVKFAKRGQERGCFGWSPARFCSGARLWINILRDSGSALGLLSLLATLQCAPLWQCRHCIVKSADCGPDSFPLLRCRWGCSLGTKRCSSCPSTSSFLPFDFVLCLSAFATVSLVKAIGY